MFKQKPILTGSSDLNQIQIIFDLVGSPTEDNMPGWSSLPGCEGVTNFDHRPGNLPQVFRECVMLISAEMWTNLSWYLQARFLCDIPSH